MKRLLLATLVLIIPNIMSKPITLHMDASQFDPICKRLYRNQIGRDASLEKNDDTGYKYINSAGHKMRVSIDNIGRNISSIVTSRPFEDDQTILWGSSSMNPLLQAPRKKSRRYNSTDTASGAPKIIDLRLHIWKPAKRPNGPIEEIVTIKFDNSEQDYFKEGIYNVYFRSLEEVVIYLETAIGAAYGDKKAYDAGSYLFSGDAAAELARMALTGNEEQNSEPVAGPYRGVIKYRLKNRDRENRGS